MLKPTKKEILAVVSGKADLFQLNFSHKNRKEVETGTEIHNPGDTTSATEQHKRRIPIIW